MPIDDRVLPNGTLIFRARSDRQVSTWLFVVCTMLLVMIMLGGATRLTGSGLSIMEWAPLSGALPPVSDSEWNRLFALYQQIPQYQLLNHGFGLAGFKQIFWLEWIHRLWGRLIGLVFLLPMLWFWWRGALKGIFGRLALFFVLGGLQGAVGWFMVASGFFPDSTKVSAYRLVVHLTMALVLYAAIFWTALSLRRSAGREAGPTSGAPSRLAGAALFLAGLTIIAGGFVAGTHAGLSYNSFPLMDGALVPAGYAQLSPFVLNWFENIPAIQFDHRLLATLTAVVAVACLIQAVRCKAAPDVRKAAGLLALLVLLQYVLGVTTLLLVVPTLTAVMHQGMAVLVLSGALILVHATRSGGAHRGAAGI